MSIFRKLSVQILPPFFKAKIINSFEKKNGNKTFVLTVILNDIVPRSVKVCKI